MSVTVRVASPADAPLIAGFIRDLAEYERLLHEVEVTEDDLRRDLFGENPRCFCDIAEHEGQPVGFALWFYNYSTFRGRAGIYLEDLFVKPETRGLGAGKALLRRLAQRCVEADLGRLEEPLGRRLDRRALLDDRPLREPLRRRLHPGGVGDDVRGEPERLLAAVGCGLAGRGGGHEPRLLPVPGERLRAEHHRRAAAALQDHQPRVVRRRHGVEARPDRVLRRHRLQLAVGELRLHERLETLGELRRAATGFGNDEAALFDVLLNDFLVLPRQVQSLVAVEVQDGRLNQHTDLGEHLVVAGEVLAARVVDLPTERQAGEEFAAGEGGQVPHVVVLAVPADHAGRAAALHERAVVRH